MNKITNAMYEIHELEELADRNLLINQVHPSIKLVVTMVYIACVGSFDKYNIFGLLPMVLYPLVLFYISEVPIKRSLRKLRIVLPVVCFVGIFNPFFDHTVIYHFYGIVITGGFISMLTLLLKGIYALLASYLFMATTGIENFCYALKVFHIPNIILTQILLLYRYIIILMQEANAVYEAYILRAPNEKGVKFKVWGSLLGQLLFRSYDRADQLYDSMILRGFDGNFYDVKKQKLNSIDLIYFILWVIIISGMKLFSFSC